jgi:hypothetical protein
MNKILKISLITLISTLSLTANLSAALPFPSPLECCLTDATTPEEQTPKAITAAFNAKSAKLSSHQPWVAFSEEFGDENIELKFPSFPVTNTLSNVLGLYDMTAIAAAEKGAVYTLLTPVEPVEIGDRKHFLKKLRREIGNFPIVILNYEITVMQFVPGHTVHVMDLYYTSLEDGTNGKSRVIVTDDNFYILTTLFKMWEKEKHQKFIQSFVITK